MSWAEVMKINDNVTKPLNEQIREARFLPIRIITATGTYTPEKTGLYKVICVGAGGNAGGDTGVGSTSKLAYAEGGGGGGVAIKTLRLSSTTSYNVTVSTTASFSTELSATAGQGSSASSPNSGGTAAGGDENYVGSKGVAFASTLKVGLAGGSVGVAITELTRTNSTTYTDFSSYITDLRYGDGLLGYGGGAPTLVYSSGSAYSSVKRTGQPAAVIIIPLEMEE